MIPFLALRYSFSRSSNHRARAVRIVISTALSLAVLMVTISVMDYLQNGRLERIRDVSSFDITIEGNRKEELSERFPDSNVFVYGECDAIGNGSAFIVRYIDESYDGGLKINAGDSSGLLVPYNIYSNNKSMRLTSMAIGRSGMMIPQTREYRITGMFSTSLGSSFDSSMLFLPLSEADQSTPMYTAIKGVDDDAIISLRSEGFEGKTWKEKEAGLYSAFIAEKTMMYIVLSLLFVIILVSCRQSVSIFFKSRETELAELIVLGLGRKRSEAVFTFSFMIIMAAGILLGLLLSLLFIPAGEEFMMAVLHTPGAELSIPFRSFAGFSAFLIFFTVVFSLREEKKLSMRDIVEVMRNE